MKLLDSIVKRFGKRLWYNRVEKGHSKREFIIYSYRYPYSEEDEVHKFAKENKIKITIQVLG